MKGKQSEGECGGGAGRRKRRGERLRERISSHDDLLVNVHVCVCVCVCVCVIYTCLLSPSSFFKKSRIKDKFGQKQTINS